MKKRPGEMEIRHLNTDLVYGGYAVSLECFEVDTSGNHVDAIRGIYATH